MGLAAAEISAPDPPVVLKKRLCEEMVALRGILRKAELVVRKTGDKGGAAPRRGKDGRFLASKARSDSSESTMKANRTPCKKKRKTMQPVGAEIIKPRMMEAEARRVPCAKGSKAVVPPVENIEHPRIPEADQAPCAKRSKAMPPVEIIEPLISEDEIFCVVTRLSSLSSNMPARIVEFLNKECACHADQKAGEMEIDLGSMRRSAMSDLQKLLDDEFAEEEKRRQQKEESMNVCRSISRSSPCEFMKEGLCSPLEEDGEMTEEIDICGDADPIAIEKFAETERSPSHSSSSSSSGFSSSSSSSGDSSSGSSSSDSSDSDSSDSDCDDECVTSNPAPTPAVVSKTDISPVAMPLKVVSPIAAQEFAATGKCQSIISNSSLLEDGEIEEEESNGGASPVAAEKFSETVNGTGSANDQSVRITQAPTVCPQPSKPQHSAQDTARDLYARSFEKKRERQRAYEKPATQDTARDLYARGFEKKLETRQRDYEKLAAQSTARDLNARGFEKKHERQRAYEKPAAQSTVRDLYARNVEMKHERQRAYEKVKEMERKRERHRAYRKLQEMERNAKPIFDSINPRHLMQLGITRPVEYAVTSERRFAAPRGCPVQSLLGLFLKQSSRAGHEEMAED